MLMVRTTHLINFTRFLKGFFLQDILTCFTYSQHVRVTFTSQFKHPAEPQPFTRWVARPVTLICKEGSKRTSTFACVCGK